MFFINSRKLKDKYFENKAMLQNPTKYLNIMLAEDSEPEALFLLKEEKIIKKL